MSRLLSQCHGPVGTVTISHPQRHNAMTFDMWRALPVVLAQLDADPAIRVIVITGEGSKAFISGADTSQFESLRATGDQSMQYTAAVEAALLAPAACSKPVIAAIQGYCIGGGLALAAACDLRLAADNATFRMPAARLGVGYPPASLQAFINIMGAANTMDLFFSARTVSAAEVLSMGFVSQVHPLEQMAQAVQRYAEAAAASAPLTIAALKFAVRQLLKDPQDRDMETAQRMAQACFMSADHREGRDALVQKRVPRFSGI